MKTENGCAGVMARKSQSVANVLRAGKEEIDNPFTDSRRLWETPRLHFTNPSRKIRLVVVESRSAVLVIQRYVRDIVAGTA